MTKTARAIYDELADIDTLMVGVDELFRRKPDLAMLLHKGEHLFEKIMVQWDHEGVPRLPQLDTSVRKLLKDGIRDTKEKAAKTKSLVAGIAVDSEPGGPWPHALSYSPKFGDDAVNGKLFLKARPARLITSAGKPYSLTEQGVWTEGNIDSLRSEIRATDAGNTLGASAVGAIVQSVKDITYTDAVPFGWIQRPDDAPEPHDLVLFRNGLLNLVSGELMPLDGSYFATATPRFDFDEEAECPRWLDWLGERLVPSYVETLQEWFGFSMVPDTNAQRFMSFIGASRSGKGTAKSVLEALIGPAHVGSTSMADLATRFGLMGAIDKRLLVMPDSKDAPAPSRGAALERILGLTGGDALNIDIKGLPPITRKLAARLLVLGNDPPRFLDESGALAARQLMIRWDRSFRGHEDARVGEGLVEELSGIANWSLEGLRRLRANNYIFSVGREGRMAVEAFRLAGAPALRFADECLVVSGKATDHVLMDKVFASYRAWVHREGLGRGQTRNKTDLGTDLQTALTNVRVAQPRGLVVPPNWSGGDYRPRVLLGVSGFKRGEEDWEDE